MSRRDRAAGARCRRGRLLGAVGLALLALGTGRPAWAQGMLNTKHNLSVTGPGTVKAASETEVCVFCHTPHNASPAAPLWNRELSGQTYDPYASATLQAVVGQPTGYSKLCLSCHDGTIAIGKVRVLRGESRLTNPIAMTGTGAGGVMPAGRTNLGTNLTNDHPVSFVFDQNVRSADGELVDPSTLTAEIRLYEGATPGLRDSVQCTTCHDPHLTVYPKFLKRDQFGQSGNLCLTCHVKPGWVGSSHQSSSKVYPPNTSTTVGSYSCRACHDPHAKQGAQRLLREGATDAGVSAIEETCYLCHRSSALGGVSYDLRTQFTDASKIRRHPIEQYLGHEPIFTTAQPADGASPPERVLLDQRHVECTDCHNPHRVLATNRFEGMRGVAINGSVVQDVTQNRDLAEFEVCFRCHGDTAATVIGAVTASGIAVSNKRTEFQPANSAFHPVAGAGRNQSANLNAQLAPNGLSTASTVRCSDCHNNNFFTRANGCAGPVSACASSLAQPRGPHGSTQQSILRARVVNTLPGPSSFSAANFELCFTCHDQTRLTSRRFSDGAQTNFDDESDPPNSRGKDNLHWFHLVDRVGNARAVCRSCHYNIHSNVAAPNTQYRINGVLSSTPPAGTPTRLVNFHPNIRGIGGRPRPEWEFDTVTRIRRCWLQCHDPNTGGAGGGATMDGFAYRPPSGDLP